MTTKETKAFNKREKEKQEIRAAYLNEQESLRESYEDNPTEDVVEDYLVKRVKECNLDIRKLNPLGNKGIPDRIVFDPKGVLNPQFVETKRPKKGKISAMQTYLARGLKTIFVKNFDEVEQLLFFYFTKNYIKPTKKENK